MSVYGGDTREGANIVDADVQIVPASFPVNEDARPLAQAPRPITNTERRSLVALGLGTFVGALVFIIPPLFFTDLSRDLHVGVPLLGQIMSAMLLLSVVLGLVVGPLADRSGFRLLIVSGLVAAALCLLVFGLVPAFPLLLLASAAGAVTDAGVIGPSFAIAGAAFFGTAARRAIGWISAAQAGSAIVAVPLLAAIGALAGWRVAFVAAALTAFVVAALAARWLPRDARRAATPPRLDSILAPYRPLLRDGTMRRLYSATILGAVCWFGLLTYLGAFLVEELRLDTSQVGLVYMVIGVGYAAGSMAVGGPFAGVPARRLVFAGFAAGGLLTALAFSARVGTPGAVAMLTGVALMMGLAGVAMTTLLTTATPTGAGTTMTLNGSLFNLGAASGSALGGVLLAFSGYQALAIGLPLFGLAAALLSKPSSRAAQR